MSSEIKVDTISENTSAGGVTIDSLGIKDGKVTNLMNATLSAADLGSGIHVKTADSGASVSGDADELVLENSRSGMTFLSATDNYGIINFGDSGDNNIGQILYYHGDNSLSFVNNAQTGITLNTDGEVTKPLQPCFRVGSGTQNNIAVSTNVTAIFDSEVFDIGSNFASNIFTAPVTGKYYLGVLMRLNAVDSAASYIQISILGSNRNTTIFTFHNATELNADADNVTVSGSTVLDMDANDTASVRIRIQSGTAQTDLDSDGSYFTGYLIG